MSMRPEFQRNALRVGKHEAGHFIVAAVLNFRVGRLFIEFKDRHGSYSGGAEISLYTRCSDEKEILDYLRRRVKVLYAGALAETLENGCVHYETALERIRIDAGSDQAKANELIQLIRNIQFGGENCEEMVQAQLSEIDAALWKHAAEIVEREQAAIVGLGERLASEVKFIGRSYCITAAELRSLPALWRFFNVDHQ